MESPQDTSVLVSVRVTGRTLCLLNEGPVNPPVEEPLPPMLYADLESLPHLCHWAVQHVMIDDDGRTVAAAIGAGVAMAVSDGSLHYTLGTSAFVIEGLDSEHRILVCNRVSGTVKEGDSHHCELAVLYAIVCWRDLSSC